MPLSSLSTDDEVLAAYEDNCSFDLNDSPDEAREFIRACRILLLRLPKMTTVDANTTVQLDTAQIRTELDRARRYLMANASGAGGGARYFDLGNCRD